MKLFVRWHFIGLLKGCFWVRCRAPRVRGTSETTKMVHLYGSVRVSVCVDFNQLFRAKITKRNRTKLLRQDWLAQNHLKNTFCADLAYMFTRACVCACFFCFLLWTTVMTFVVVVRQQRICMRRRGCTRTPSFACSSS